MAGRAGRGTKGGRVLVQTRHPTHHALRHAARHDAEGFIAEELILRREPAYPPETALVNLVVSGPDQSATGSRAAEVRQHMVDRRIEHRAYTREVGDDSPDVRDWVWPFE